MCRDEYYVEGSAKTRTSARYYKFYENALVSCAETTKPKTSVIRIDNIIKHNAYVLYMHLYRVLIDHPSRRSAETVFLTEKSDFRRLTVRSTKMNRSMTSASQLTRLSRAFFFFLFPPSHRCHAAYDLYTVGCSPENIATFD
jgi:hypothetical protein